MNAILREHESYQFSAILKVYFPHHYDRVAVIFSLIFVMKWNYNGQSHTSTPLCTTAFFITSAERLFLHSQNFVFIFVLPFDFFPTSSYAHFLLSSLYSLVIFSLPFPSHLCSSSPCLFTQLGGGCMNFCHHRIFRQLSKPLFWTPYVYISLFGKSLNKRGRVLWVLLKVRSIHVTSIKLPVRFTSTHQAEALTLFEVSGYHWIWHLTLWEHHDKSHAVAFSLLVSHLFSLLSIIYFPIFLSSFLHIFNRHFLFSNLVYVNVSACSISLSAW